MSVDAGRDLNGGTGLESRLSQEPFERLRSSKLGESNPGKFICYTQIACSGGNFIRLGKRIFYQKVLLVDPSSYDHIPYRSSFSGPTLETPIEKDGSV